MQGHLDWLPMPTDIECGSKARKMVLPAIRPLQFSSWKDFQVGWFWNLFFASAKRGGYLPAGSELWQTAGAHTRARWDANGAAVLAAFGCTQPDADGRFFIYYPPLIEILDTQKKKYRKKAGLTLSEASTGLHNEEIGYSPSISLSFDFDLDSNKKDQNLNESDTRGELSIIMENDHNTSRGMQGSAQYDVTTAAKRVLQIVGLDDGFLAAAMAAVEVELKGWSKPSMDAVVQRITTAANLARRNGDISIEEFFEDFLAQKSAKRILNVLNLPVTNSFVFRLTAVVKAEAKDTNLSVEETAVRITQAAIEDRRKGIPVNMFYFEDMKWRSNAGTSKAEQRKLNNLEVNAKVKQRLREKMGAS